MEGGNFIDYVKICFRSGKGGSGAVHFYRGRGIPKGGPDGGDGGRGGHIIVRGNKQLWTLLHLKYRKHVVAQDGQNGGENRMTGKQGKDEIIEVPLGTVIRNYETGEVKAEITEHGQEVIVTHGGRGGLGNDRFKTPTNRAPRYAQPGEPGKEEWIILELKLLADVGLVGFPNAGKSTLLSVLSAAKPEIADYPFTTLVPNLGVVKYRDYHSFVVADIPGIIEGASEGRGLGIRFLRHIERNSLLLFTIPADSKNYREEYEILNNELRKYNPELMYKPRLLAITKADLLTEKQACALEKLLPNNVPTIVISSHTNYNIEKLKDMIWQILNK